MAYSMKMLFLYVWCMNMCAHTCAHRSQGDYGVSCFIIPYFILWRLTGHGSRLRTSKPQLPSCLLPSQHLGGHKALLSSWVLDPQILRLAQQALLFTKPSNSPVNYMLLSLMFKLVMAAPPVTSVLGQLRQESCRESKGQSLLQV